MIRLRYSNRLEPLLETLCGELAEQGDPYAEVRLAVHGRVLEDGGSLQVGDPQRVPVHEQLEELRERETVPGTRHRLTMGEAAWRFERG